MSDEVRKRGRKPVTGGVVSGIGEAARLKEERMRRAREAEQEAKAAYEAQLDGYGRALGRLAVAAGLGDFDLKETELLAAFRDLAERFRKRGSQTVALGAQPGTDARSAEGAS